MKIKRIDSHLECLYSSNLACQNLIQHLPDCDLVLELQEIINMQYEILVDYIEDTGIFTCDELLDIHGTLEKNYLIDEDYQWQI